MQKMLNLNYCLPDIDIFYLNLCSLVPMFVAKVNKRDVEMTHDSPMTGVTLLVLRPWKAITERRRPETMEMLPRMTQ